MAYEMTGDSDLIPSYAWISLARVKPTAKHSPNDLNHLKPARLALSLVANLGLLGYFKYANFFIDSWTETWSAIGVTMHASVRLQESPCCGVPCAAFHSNAIS